MTYACPVCGNEMSEYGTAGMTCTLGHHFLAADVRRTQTPKANVRSRRVPVYPWLPGAVLGGLALLIELVRAVI